ncbi:MAG: ribosomal-processing cysteine protease Prp [Clostridia bacterium]|nr:ribosomal-processing cysteine protease Prp [Clostridia bacterium]
MIKVKFFSENNLINGFEISGHSGYSEAGSDIVCSAVSSAAEMTANTITEIIRDKAEVTVSEGFLRLTVTEGGESSYKLLEGLKLHLEEISKQYPQNIRIIYGGTKNA